MEYKTEYYTGSDCTGSDGATSRVLTISNDEMTKGDGFLVSVAGLTLSLTTEYTVNHNSENTEITFVNAVWDDSAIVVHYVQQVEGAGVRATGNDFILGPLADFGVEVTRTPVTVTTDFSGDKTYTDGTDETIDVVFENPSQSFNLDKAGLTEAFDAKMYTEQDQTISKYDKITYDSKVYRVDTIRKVRFDGNGIFKTVTLFFVEDE